MGALTVVGIAAGAIGAGADIYEKQEQMGMQEEAEHAQEQELNQQMMRQKAAAAQQQILRDNQLQQVQSQQEAASVAHGMALSSGTFNALSMASYNNFAEATNVGNLNLQIENNDINERIRAGRKELATEKEGDFFGELSDVAGLGFSTAAITGGFGKKGPSLTASSDPDLESIDKTENDMSRTFSQQDDPNWMYSRWLKSQQELF